MIFTFDEMSIATGAKTGRSETYDAYTLEEAAENCLYTYKLKNGNAKLGPTNHVIYPSGAHGDLALVLRASRN